VSTWNRIEACRRPLDHDALQAEHDHRGEHLLLLTSEGAAGERHQAFRVAARHALVRADAQRHTQRVLARHVGAFAQLQRAVGGQPARLGRVRQRERAGETIGQPCPRARIAEIRRRETVQRR
jgi:hypothetical protein